MRISRFQPAFLAFVLMVVGSLTFVNLPVIQAQVTTASIHGTVTDPSGALLPNAKVTALNTATGISAETTSNQSGFFIFPSLQIGGPYTVTIEAPGFQKVAKTDIMLTVNANLEESATLAVGTQSQTVTVSSSAVQVETANTQLEQVVPASQLENLPMLGRDAAAMERLAPGVVESSDRMGSYSVNGNQTQSNAYMLEGIDNNDGPLQDEGLAVNPDALQEENIVSSTINPEFGRNSGSVINEVVKPGTNQIHGSGFEFYRDTFMNLPGYFALPGERTPYHQNLFGGTLGGPVIKNRLFGFAAYQGSRARTGAIVQTPVFQSGILPTSTNPGGNFSNEQNVANGDTNINAGLTDNAIPFPIVVGTGTGVANPGATCGPETELPNWDDCFPVGSPVVINTSSFNSVALKLAQKYVPSGNAGTAMAPYFNFPTANTSAQDQGVLRVDYHISDHDSIYGTGIFQSSPSTRTLPFGGSTLPGFGMINAEHFKLFAAQETHMFSPNTLNVLRAGYYRFNFAAVEPAKVVDPASLGFNIHPQNVQSGIPNMDLTGLFTIGFSYEGPQPRKDTNLTYSDNLSHIAGNHDLKFGVNVEQFRVSNPYSADNNGDFSYGGAGAYSSGDPGIDFLLGIPDSYAQTSGGFIDTIAWEDYAFAQDSWHVNNDLTLNYGIAWDVETPNSNVQFKGLGITCFYLSSQTSKVFPGGFPGLLFPGDPGCNTQGGATTKYTHFGPRLGFAWSPSGGPEGLIGGAGAHKLSIRGGIGLYYNRDAQEGQLQNLGDIPNFLESHGAADFGGSPGFLDPFSDVAGGGTEANVFPYVRPAAGTPLDWPSYVGLDTSSIDPHYSTPYVYNFNLNIQRQLPGNMVLQFGYVGSVGHRLATTYDADPITAAGHAACLTNTGAEAGCTSSAGRAQQHLFFPQNTSQPATIDGIPDYLDVGALATRGSSNYNSFQLSLVNNSWHGLYFTFAYTYAHSLDNASGLESSGFNGRGMNNVPGFQHLNYGDSDFDARHRVVASYDYKVPLLQAMNENFAIKEILGDWHVAGITVLQTGFPVTILDEGTYRSLYCDLWVYYGCPDEPNLSNFNIKEFNPRMLNSDGLNSGFDGSNFTQETVGTFGNVKRNFFHGPGYNYTDLSVYKNLPLGHDSARNVQIMLQAANVFNHANFAPPDGNFTDGLYFGTVSAVDDSSDYNGDPEPGRTARIVAKINF
ncbi:MAG TPA: carboxypeptidase regulatory-like domain-containing protein [Terracidiphilus sp.]|nr:carboxypeptidase regulatory-like domain-containing protein [Terracidiphilus sp.]